MTNNLIDLSEVLLSGNTSTLKEYDKNLVMDKFSSRLGEYDILSSDVIHFRVSSPSKNNIHIEGHVNMVLGIPCDRCLEIVNTPIEFDVSKDIKFDNGNAVNDEDMDDTSYVDGHTVNVDEMLYSEILANIPMKVLCSEDCKGICNRCGMNLNKGTCDCDTFEPDPRMSVISDIFKNFGKN